MVFGLLRKLGGAFWPFKDASQGMRNCGAFRDFLGDRERSRVCNRCHVFGHNYKIPKKGTDYCSPPREERSPPFIIIKNTSPIPTVPPPPTISSPAGGGRTTIPPPPERKEFSPTLLPERILSYPYGPPPPTIRPLVHTSQRGGDELTFSPPERKESPHPPLLQRTYPYHYSLFILLILKI